MAPSKCPCLGITLQIRITGLWAAPCSPLRLFEPRSTSAPTADSSPASSTVAFAVAVVHRGAAALVDHGRWAVEAVLAVDLAVLQLFVGWLAILVFSSDIARHSVQWDNF